MSSSLCSWSATFLWHNDEKHMNTTCLGQTPQGEWNRVGNATPNPPIWKLSVNTPASSIIFCDLWGKQYNYYVWTNRWKASCQGRWHYGISDKLYSLVKVLHDSNIPNISDNLAFTLLVSLKHYLNVGYWLSMGEIIWESRKTLDVIAAVNSARTLWFVASNINNT